MMRSTVFSLPILMLTGAFGFIGCTVERGYDDYAAAQDFESQTLSEMRAVGELGSSAFLSGELGPIEVDAPASVDNYSDEYFGGSAQYELNVFENSQWAMSALYIENGTLDSLELGQPYVFKASSIEGIRATGIGCSSESSIMEPTFDEEFEEVEIVVEEGEAENERVVMFNGRFPNGKEVQGGFNLSDVE